VVIDLGNGISVAKSPQTFPVPVKDLLIDRRKTLLQPGEECGTQIETDGGVVIDDLKDLAFPIQDPGMSIGPVTLQSDSLIPVMEGMGALLGLKDFEPGVLSWGLVEVTVNGDKCVFHVWSFQGNLIFNALSYITLPISKQFLAFSFLEVWAASKT
jgi:hypothetical protein